MNKYILKLSDFGESRWNSGTIANTAAKGTAYYMSPELHNYFRKILKNNFQRQFIEVQNLKI